MATFDELMQAARRADAAGDEAAARRLVQAAVKVRDTAPERPVAEPEAPEPAEPLAVEYATQDEAVPTFEIEGGPQTVETEADLPPFELPRQEPERLPATFRPVEETRKSIEELVDERVQAILEERDELVTDATRAEAEARRRVEEDIARQRGRMVIAGREDKPVEPTSFLPMGRPTRIVNRRVRAQAGEDFEGFLTDQVERLYRDPDTGALRKPSPFEELVETFAAQPLMTEAEARAADERLQAQKAAIRERMRAGEKVGFEEAQLVDPGMSFGRTIAGAVESAMREEDETGGVYESALGATLRSVPAFLSAALRAGSFYDVDEEGRPVDPESLAYNVAQLREGLGLPAVVTRVPTITGTIPTATPFPLPGLAVEQRRRDTVGTDPEARRARPQVDAPSILDDPSGWFAAEAERIARTIQNDRGMGDDFVDSPEVRAAYVDLYGDPDAAYWAGTLADVFVPAGPGTAFRTGKRALQTATELAGETKTAARLADELITRAEASNATRAERSLSNALADVAAVVVPGRASDGRVVRVVADKVLDITPGLTDTERAAMKAAVKPTSNTPAEVVRDMAKAIDKPATDADVQRLLTEVELRTPDDLVMVTEAVAVPRKLAPQARKVAGDAFRELQTAETAADQAAILRRYEMPAYARQVEEAGGLAELDPRLQNVLREQVKTQALYRAVPEISRRVRKTETLSEFNTYLDRMSELKPAIGKGASGPLMRRLGAMYGSFNYALTPASVSKAIRALEAAGASATREVKRALVAEARASRSAEEALDKVFARELGDLEPDALYARILGDMYGGEVVPNLMKRLAVDDAALGGQLLGRTPTLESLRRLDTHAVANGYVKAHGRGPEIDRAMLRAILEEGVRKRRALGGKEFEAALVASGTRRADVPENVGGFFRVPERLDPQAGAPGVRMREYRILGDPTTEGRLIEGTDELVKVLGNEPGLQRLGFGEWLAAQTGRLAANIRDAEYGMRYGYYLPNVPYLVGRAVALPIVSIATIGAENTMRSLARAAGKVVPDGVPLYPRSRRMGLGITDPDGVYYSPKVLDDLLEAHGGLGRTAIEQARISRLGDDIIREVETAAGGRGAQLLSDANPFNPYLRNFYQKTAEAIELSYRRSVFEAGIAHGLLPSDAALLARRSLLDYASTPGIITDTVGSLFVDAGEMYQLALQFGDLAARNPQYLTRIAKATRAKQKAQDRYGLEGDRTLRALGIVPTQADELTIYGPDSPHLRPIEKTLDLLRSADFVAQRLVELRKTTGRADFSGALDTGLEAAGEVVRYGASQLLPGVLDAFEATVGKDMGRATEQGRDLQTFDDREAFWAALLAADYADPRHDDGTWNATIDLLQPKVVKPPGDLAVPGHPDLWAAQPPEGVPHIALGLTREGVPRYKVFEPSEVGLRNLQAIRSTPLRSLESAFGAAASYYGSSDNIEVDALFPEGAPGVVGRLLGGRAVPSAMREEDVQRARQSEAIRAVREDVR